MANVTNHMLRKILTEVNRESRTGVRGLSTTTNNNTNTAEEQKLILQEKKIVKVQGTTLISDDNVKATLLNPLPSTKWKCNGEVNSNGSITLTKPLTAVIIGDGLEKNYVIGVTGDTEEFEIMIQSGKTLVNINNTYISTQTDHRIENGVERKNE